MRTPTVAVSNRTAAAPHPSPLPASGEREGPAPQAWEGEGHPPTSKKSHVETLAAAAAALFVRVAEDETGLQLFFDVVHLGAEDEHDRLRVDQDRHPLGLDDLVELALLVGVFARVAEARAAARAHPDAHPRRRLATLGEQRLDAFGRCVRHRQ